MRAKEVGLILSSGVCMLITQGCGVDTLWSLIEAPTVARQTGAEAAVDRTESSEARTVPSADRGEGGAAPAVERADQTNACPEVEPDAVSSVIAWTDPGWFQHHATADAVRRCLAAGADSNALNPVTGQRVLHLATEYASSAVAAELVAAGAMLDARDGDDLSPLHLAAVYNREDTLQLLLNKGADPNIATRDGFTPLHGTAMAFRTMRTRHGHDGRCSGPVKNFADLLSHGARTGAKDGTGLTPMERAGPWQDDLRQLLSEKCGIAAMEGHSAESETIAGAPSPVCSDLDRQDTSCWAAVAGQEECYLWNRLVDRPQSHPGPPDSVAWTGGCLDGKASGSGTETMRWDDGSITLRGEGSYVDGRRHGRWVLPHGDGVLGGTFVNGEKHGHWVMHFGGGNVWEGSYANGRMHGHWVLSWANGDVWEGPFAHGEKHGHWKLRHADGGISVGPYVNGKQHGHWVNRYSDGSSREGPYVFGREDGWWTDRYSDGSCFMANVSQGEMKDRAAC